MSKASEIEIPKEFRGKPTARLVRPVEGTFRKANGGTLEVNFCKGTPNCIVVDSLVDALTPDRYLKTNLVKQALNKFISEMADNISLDSQEYAIMYGELIPNLEKDLGTKL